MNVTAEVPLNLLHRSAVGTLATHSREPQGFPYPTILPFMPDARHRPVVLVSRLAEHTRNLAADERAGFLVTHADGDDVLSGERVTLIGRCATVKDEATLARRYLRYHPEAERYLTLGDFSFWVMAIERLRYIGGFGVMGWLDGAELDPLDPLADDDENVLIASFDRDPRRPQWLELVGVDRYGADLKAQGARRRYPFDSAKLDSASLERALHACMESFAQ